MRFGTLNRAVIRNLCVWLFVALVAGCGGGNGDTSGTSTPPAAVEPSVTADPGNIVAVRVGQTAVLDGSKSSTTTTNALQYEWSFSSIPDGSKATLSGATSANPSFVADVTGTYRVQLIVRAGSLVSQRTIALVEVTQPGDNLTGIRDHTTFTSQCLECHDGRFAQGDGPIAPVPPKFGLHPATSNLCQACHTTFGFNVHRGVDHQEVFGSCSFCHNGVLAIGKSDFHEPTTAECSDCHDTVSFLTLVNGKYDHTGITTNCLQCHDGVRAIGKTTPQLLHDTTDVDCSYCHTPAGFVPAYPDHSVFLTDTTRCDSCHNPSGGGVNATDQPVGHPIMLRTDGTTIEDCRTCHNVNGFNMGGVYPHRLVDPTVLACKTCHNDDPANSINARGISSDPTPPHVPDPLAPDQDCAHCHITTAFFPPMIDHNLPSVVAQECKACHEPAPTGNGSGLGRPVNHIPYDTVTVDCEACHAPPGGGTFATGFFNHTAFGVTNGCQNCHDNTHTAGKPFNHIPTTPDTQDCVDCHAASVANNFVNFTGGVYSHAGITSGCQSCHDGVIATGKASFVNHIPTTPDTQDCVDCHAASLGTFPTPAPGDFTGGLFAHTGVTSGCATCHDGTYVTSGAIPKKLNHIPAQSECSQCHLDTTVTGGFANTIFFTSVHPNFNNGCEGCHKTTYFPLPSVAVKDPATHLPTPQDCHYCHVNLVPGGFLLANSIFNHTGISGNCESCHDGSTKNRNAGARGKIDHPTTHVTTTLDCVYCHDKVDFANGFLDHTQPPVAGNRCDSCHNGTDAIGIVDDPTPPHLPIPVVNGTPQDCSDCHVAGGAFKPSVFNHTGIVDNCASCHDGTFATGKIDDPTPPHPPTIINGIDRDCSYCHNTTGFANAKYDHTGIVDNCADCHDGIVAPGKNGTHVPTNDDCSYCHWTTGFIPALFEHTTQQLGTKRCDSCHNGVFATGKIDDPTPPHPITNPPDLDCGYCHTVGLPFSSAMPDHTNITGGCRDAGCHEPNGAGTYYTSPPHVPTTEQCIKCHSTSGGFLDGVFVHVPADTQGQCTNCHFTGGYATPMPPTGPTGHFDTAGTVQCDDCHNTTAWAPANTFAHCNPPGTTPNSNSCTIGASGKYPGDHATGKTTCISCHKNNAASPFTYPYPTDSTGKLLSPECAACHRNRFASVDKHIGGKSGTVYQNRDCSNGGSGCHRVSARTFN